MQQLEEPTARATGATQPTTPPSAAGARSTTRVLLVHSDASYRRTLSAYLAGQGFDLVVCESGREALRDACAMQPDAVLMDLEGDEFDEFELLSCFATLPRRIPAVVCSVYAGTPGPEQAVLHELGVHYVLPRPCRLELIVRALREIAAERATHSGVEPVEGVP